MGTKEEGDACTQIGVHMSDCAQGLQCLGRCYDRDDPDPAFLLGEGEACVGPSGQLGLCAEGLGCDRDEDVCRMFPEAGSPCTTDDECNLSGYRVGRCDGMVCVALAAIGEPCTDDAECAYACEAGQCAGSTSGPVACFGAFL